ncbi:hypothetical protein POM88_041153 [Heracleum sosnowskyi]|uniref:Uncharacterized protein n=1 Tax=Heracleum sosnowskyi TaxID=360622 RepID=A0AAD8HG95_9APIA|nr:hypothetical protein POM88_041153 [Heracleum sosnowskyi]
MARIRLTARKRVRAMQAARNMVITVDQVFAAKEADDFETQHDEALLAAEDDPVDDPMEDLEEDTEDPDEDPEEDPKTVFDFPTPLIPSIDGYSTDDDDSTEGDQIVPDVVTTDDDETSEDSASREGIRMYPLPIMRVLTPPVPPLSPLPSNDDYDLAPEGYEEDQAMTDPDTPPPSPTGVPTVIHDWMIGRLTTDLAAAEARADELRRQLAAERETRRSYQDGMRFMTPMEMRLEISRIEWRAMVRMRGMSVIAEGLVPRLATERIWADAMDYEEEEYESTQNVEVPGGNPMDQFMHLLRQNLNQHPPPPPPSPNTAGHSAFKAFKSLGPPEF